MLQVLVDGTQILISNFTAIMVALFSMSGLGLFASRMMGAQNWSPEARTLGSLPLGFLLLAPVTFLLMVAGYFAPAILNPAALLILAASCGWLIYERWRGELKIDGSMLAGGIFLLGLLLLRLAYLSYAPLPGYSDSTVHYEIISSFLNPASTMDTRQPLTHLFNNYYHYGFHSITAWLSLAGGMPIERSMLLVGQLALVLLPISIFVLAEAITGNKWAAVTSGALAAIGWTMPAFAVNWGKYPALCAVAVVPALVGVLIKQPRESYRKPAVIFVLFWLMAGSALLHTRILLCLAFAGVASMGAMKMEARSSLSLLQGTRLGILFLGLLFPLYDVITGFYAAIPLLLVVALMLPFAFSSFPKAGTGIFFFTLLLWLSMVLPTFLVRRLPPLLDEQFISMILFIPLSLVGGMGLAGVMKQIPVGNSWRWAAPALLVLALLSNFRPQALQPDPCCDYAQKSDVEAMEWIRSHTPQESLFVISAHEGRWRNVGSDAGIWIHPLTGRATNKLSYESDWSSAAQIEEVCSLGAENLYVYDGNRPDSFQVDREAQKSGLNLVFQTGETAIFEITTCPDARLE